MTYVITYNEIVGTHKWGNAPERYKYLANEHRHVFKIRCWFKVSHADRDIEINIKQHEIETVIKKEFSSTDEKGAAFGNMSCEMICDYLIERFGCVCCEVLEDGFGGAFVRRFGADAM